MPCDRATLIMHQQVLKLRETVLGKEHLGTLSSPNNMAQVLSR